jgi:hypothetical protein
MAQPLDTLREPYMRNMTPRPATHAVPFAAVVLAAAACQGVIYLFAVADIGLAAACASMLAIAAIVVASVVIGRSESERRLVSAGPAPEMPARRARAHGLARSRA